ncbi:hypothetical protein [Nodosilinea sp. E11]|uniref:hypothetical protein n=1 Tax=Nodosilinea sp. E11 TaxID=3037479 RepID=UPI002934BBD3|nr:hypothetical protein [Nodosilinea sp. E11]WOD39223.1 hypothetical protein RRF56_23740 [Nodosilinea sp. E11]
MVWTMDRDRPTPAPESALQPLHRAEVWQQPVATDLDPQLWATQYLGVLRDLAVQPSWISLAHIADPPGEVLLWMGQHLYRVNQRLNEILADLLDCFAPAQQPNVQILAAPLAPQAKVDGFCNDRTQPITLMVDPGRIVPADWPGLVAHELAHAIAQGRRDGASESDREGHSEPFRRAIAHLCLAQDLPLPAPQLEAAALRYWPPCRRNPQPEQFWLGLGNLDLPGQSAPGG